MSEKIKPAGWFYRDEAGRFVRWTSSDTAATRLSPELRATLTQLFTVEQVEEAVAAERERCAKVCEQADEDGEGPDCWGWHSKDYAKAIRAAEEAPKTTYASEPR